VVAGRLALRRVGDHRILDDSYNANPGSMVAGLQVLAGRPGRRLAILGAMGELGADRDHGHRLVGAEAAALGLPLIVVGESAAQLADAYRTAGGPDCRAVATREDAVAEALRFLREGPTTVLVKASRSAGLEFVVEGLAKGASC
jgi:UDP-N-acetylmuramoyl-tripeptide--D-alanyl-D-alanine ligase